MIPAPADKIPMNPEVLALVITKIRKIAAEYPKAHIRVSPKREVERKIPMALVKAVKGPYLKKRSTKGNFPCRI